MRFNPRPSKIFFYNKLEKELKKYKEGIALDAASAGFKHSNMFHTSKYYGFDIDIDALKRDYTKCDNEQKKGIWGDLRNIKKLPKNSIDLVVSTNTLYVLSKKERASVIYNLIRLVSPGGHALLEITKDGNEKKNYNLLRGNFEKVTKVYYKNIISNKYEKAFGFDGDIRKSRLAMSKIGFGISWLLSRFEYITSRIGFLNKHIFFVCEKRKTSSVRNPFDLSHLPQINNNIYNIMN